MAGTVINLADPISTLVIKTNTISNHVGDITGLNVGGSNDSDLVQAINFINGIVQKTDSADILKLILANSVDTGESIALIRANSVDTGETTSLITANSLDSSEVINLVDSAYVQLRETTQPSIRAQFQKDSANAIGYDSSQGRFFVPSNTINSAMIENAAIISGKLATNSVGTDAIVDGNVTGPKIGSNAVGTIKINGSAVTTAKINNLAVTTAKIANSNVTTDKIANDAVTEDKIGDDAVSSVQLKTLSTLLIKDVSGNTLKTIHGAGA